MTAKTTKTLYWSLTGLFCAFMLFSAIGGMMHPNGDKGSMVNLGYPSYFLYMLGVGKISGVIALLQNRFKTIKEWAFAGFTIDFVSAFWSMAASGVSGGMLTPPVIALALTFGCYYLWKKL